MKSVKTFRILSLLLAVLTLAAVAMVPALAAPAEVELGFDVRFTGVITAVGAAAGDPWTIGGQTLATDGDTMIMLTTATAEPGMWADVAAKVQPDNSLLAKQITVRPPEVRLKGIVSAKPETGTVGDWVIAGVTVKVVEDTVVAARGAAVGIDSWVEAVLVEAPAGVLTAKRIVAISALDAVEISGAIQSFSDTQWVLSSIPLAVNSDTLISGTPVVGLIAHAAAQLQDDGTLLAQGLRVSWIAQNSLRPLVNFDGVVEKLPASSLRGEWTVSGQTVMTLPNTRINQERGLAVVGATVNVVGWNIGGKVYASQITVLSSPVEGGEFVWFAGLIEALPADGILGEWAVSGVKVLVTDQTKVEGSTPAVGLSARVEGARRASDGVVIASTVRVRAVPIRPGVTPSVTPPVTPPARPTRPPRP